MAHIADVVIVNYNSGGYLRRCLASVLRSDGALNIVVVDNASSDTSLTEAKSLPSDRHSLTFIENSDNRGFAAAVNQAASHGSSGAIFLLNPDCVVYPHTVSMLVSTLMQREGSVGAVGALVLNEDGSEQRGSRRYEPTFRRSALTALGKDYLGGVNRLHEPMPEGPVEVEAVSGAAMLVRRSSFNAIGGMDEGYFLHVEDIDLCRRIRNAGQTVLFSPSVSVFHHQGVSSRGVPFRTEWHKHQGMLRYYREHLAGEDSIFTKGSYRLMVAAHLLTSLLRHAVGGVIKKPSLNEIPSDPFRFAGQQTVLVVGARSDLGQAVVRAMQAEWRVIGVSQQSMAASDDERWFQRAFFEKIPASDFQQLCEVQAVVVAAPVWVAEAWLRRVSRLIAPNHLRKAVVFSSTSILAKQNSHDQAEQAVVAKLKEGEAGVLHWAKEARRPATVLRASMIYGGEQNQNVQLMARIARVFRVFPLIDKGGAQRQPVHVADLAQACQQVMAAEALPEQVYLVAGGEALSYREMVARIFRSVGRRPRFIRLSPGLLKAGVRLLRRLPKLGFLNEEMISRMQQDLVYDCREARRDFAYNPGKFRP